MDWLGKVKDKYDMRVINAMLKLRIFSANDLRKRVDFLSDFTPREVGVIIKYLDKKYPFFRVNVKPTNLFKVYAIEVVENE